MQAKSGTKGTPYEHLCPERNLFAIDNVRDRARTKPISQTQNILSWPATADGRVPVLQAGGKPSVPENKGYKVSSKV